MSNNGDRQLDPIVVAQQHRPAASRVIPPMLDFIFMCAMRSVSFFDEANRFVRENQFNEATEQHYIMLWRALSHVREDGGAFTHANVMVELHNMLSTDPGWLHPEYQGYLLREDRYGLVWSAFNAPTEEIDLHTARSHLRAFLNERTVANPLRRFIESVGNGEHPSGLNEFLAQINSQQQLVESMTTLPVVQTVPGLHDTWEAPLIYHESGLSWIDDPVHGLGGFTEGDAIGILGGTGSGKSTLGAHIAVECAKREYSNAISEGRSPRWVAFLTYEESVKKMRVRVWSAGFKIQRERLQNLTHPASQLTHRGNMLEYERTMEGVDPDNLLSEQERWVAGSEWMNKTLKLFDMSGSREFPNAGRGFIPEIAACIDATAMQLGVPPLAILIDYAGLVCRGYMDINNMDDSRLRHLLSTFGNRIRREVAERFSATAIVLHQLAPQEGQRSSTSLLHHSMSSESKAFAENLTACGCIGNPDPQTGCRLLNWSKIRYQAQEKVRPVTLRVDDNFARMDNVTDIYAVDSSSRRFVLRTAMEQVSGGVPSGQRGPSPNPPQIGINAAPAPVSAEDDDPDQILNGS